MYLYLTRTYPDKHIKNRKQTPGEKAAKEIREKKQQKTPESLGLKNGKQPREKEAAKNF
jgi:hypothetical protein